MDIVLKEKVVKGFPYVRDNKFLEECHRRGWSSPEQYKSVLEGVIPGCRMCSHRGLGVYSQAPLIGLETEVLFHSLFPGYYGGSQADSYGRRMQKGIWKRYIDLLLLSVLLET